DAILSKIAQAQAQAGDRRAALQTVSQIDDDRTSSESLSTVRSQRIIQPGRPGGNAADFDTLIDLIQSTIAPQAWSDTGGPGTLMGFEGGVFIDAQGVLRPLMKEDHSVGLVELRRFAVPQQGNSEVRLKAGMRKISLVRLERQVQLLAAQGRQP